MYIKLEDASNLRFPDGGRVTTPEIYLGWHAFQIAERGLARVRDVGHATLAYVNHGRWIADCPTCGYAMFTHPEWRVACCCECGSVYQGVTFPIALDDIVKTLLARPSREKQNWFPGETVTDLLAENIAHRVTEVC